MAKSSKLATNVDFITKDEAEVEEERSASYPNIVKHDVSVSVTIISNLYKVIFSLFLKQFFFCQII